ncbi:hypothetical protein [Methylobacterium thuringiense]|uniref:Uncharacterized protein n=1 Tax=Methylobacterium thuringiense TaxID=1003091 RepID=A0ABQ4TPW4_9HYPH|nr:hypothetical protein [Methylobacterium thuringiense]GJE57346.1 hypothetical protein EKPJFOCH_3860 [Methylobacterium thuringiense]
MQIATALEPIMTPGLKEAEVPREAMWRHYQTIALGGAEAARQLSEELVAILLGQRSDDFAAFVQHVEALGVVHQHLAAAASGLDAVRTSHGVA